MAEYFTEEEANQILAAPSSQNREYFSEEEASKILDDPQDFSRVPIPDVGALRVPGTVPLEQRASRTPTRAEMQDGSLRELPPEGVVSKARRFLAPLIGAPNGEIMRGPAASDVDRRGFVRAIFSPEKKTFPRLTGEDIATGNIKALLPGNLNEAGENPESFYNSTPGYEVPTWAKIATGAQRAVAGTADVVANPMLTAGFAMTAGAPLLGRVASATFGVQMLKDLPDVTHSFNEAVKAGDVQGATEALVGGGLGTYFGVKAIQHAGRPGIAKESPMVRRLLSKQITETFTPEQLKESFIRVTKGEATPQEQELFRFVNEAFESPKEAIKSGVKVTQSEPAMESKFWRDYLGLEKGTKGISLLTGKRANVSPDARNIPPEQAAREWNQLTEGEQNANRQQSSVPQTRSDQAESIQAIPERIPGEVQPVAGESGGQGVKTPRPFTPPAPVEVPESAPPLREFKQEPTMDYARAIASMTPEEFMVSGRSFNNVNIALGQTATPTEVDELKKLRDDVEKRRQDMLKVLESKQAKGEEVTIKDHNDFGAISMMPQFFNEAIAEASKRAAIVEKSDEKRVPTTTVLDPAGGYPVHEIDVDPKTIELSKDVPQFKEGAGTGGEVQGQELKGKYTRVGTGRTVVWERLNGNREIVTGRHKWQLALRNRLKDFPVQIVREADGFTRDMALVLDAESNIRDNQGSVRDYAHYFRQTPQAYTKEAAIQRGLLRDAKGRNGWDIGRNASDDLYSIWRAEKVSDGQAVAIAKAAPGNADLQALGIKQALAGSNPEQLVNFLKAVSVATQGKADQIDMFGNNDAALNQAVEIGKKAAARQREIYDEVRAVQGAAKNPTVAARHGVDVKDPQGVLKRIGELKAEIEQWENWELHPELIAQLTTGEKAKGVRGNGKKENNEKGQGQDVLKPKTGSPEKSGGQSVKNPLTKGQTEISRDQALAIHGGSKKLLPAKGETKQQPSDTTGEYFVGQTEDGRFFTEHKPKESNETVTDTSGRFEGERSIAKAAADHLRESIGADQLSIAGAQASSRQARILSEWATKNGLMLNTEALAKLPKLSDDTHEHHVALDESNDQVIKQTWPGSFGNGPVKSDTGIWREHLTPLQYLERIELQNKVFGDTTKVIGFAFYPERFMRRPGGLSIVTSQHFVQIGDENNPTPSKREIDKFMESRGFESIPGEVPLWRRASDGVLVMDARADNFIKTPSGAIIPIDLQIGKEPVVSKTSKGSELNLDIPLTLRGEQAKTIAPSADVTAFGGDALVQNDLFAIAEVTKNVDPFKSADAAQAIAGGSPTKAIATLERQLATVDNNKDAKKLFVKEQRDRLKEVINVLRERADKQASLPSLKERKRIYYKDLAKVEFPSMPEPIADSLAGYMSETTGVMQSDELLPNESMRRAVRAFIRHNKTDYESNFSEGMERGENRAIVGSQIDKIYNLWREGYVEPKIEQANPIKPREASSEEIQLVRQLSAHNKETKQRKQQGLVGEDDLRKIIRWDIQKRLAQLRESKASLPDQVTPVGQPQPPVQAKTLPELRALVNSPAAGLSKEAVTLINAFLDSPLADTLDGLTIKIQDVVENGWDGSYFQGVVELARNADPKAGVHEFLHRAWEVLPQDIKAEFERMRIESLKDELAKTEDETRKQQIQDLIDNPTSGTADFLARGLPRDLYELSRAEELFTHSGSDQFKAKVGSVVDGFWARVKEFLKDFVAALKKAFKFKQSQEDWLRNILNGNFRIDPDAAGYAKVGNAVITTRKGIVDLAGKASLTTYHGTPHKVDRFTTAKIGTGEGAQVYGWGLYFAENEAVARDYRDRLSPKRDSIDPASFSVGRDYYHRINGRYYKNGSMDVVSKSEYESLYRKAVEQNNATPAANAYTVSLNVEPEDLLDWDKPLSEQSEKVRKAFHEQWIAHQSDHARQTGAQIYESYIQNGSIGTPKRASERFASLGIKGIRYLDHGSRGPSEKSASAGLARAEAYLKRLVDGGIKGDLVTSAQSHVEDARADLLRAQRPTYNYVIFDDKDISITHENGQPVSVGEVVAGKQGSLPTGEVADNAERARAETGLNLTDLELPKDVARLAEEQGREGVPTETFNIVNFVNGRQRLDDSFRQAGQRFTQQVFAEIGIPVRSGPADLSVMADPANPDPVAWAKMIDRLKKELAEQRVEGRADATGGLVNFLDSLILMWQTQRQAFELMPPEIGRQLFQFAQGERSFRGLLLGAMAHLDNSVVFTGQNVDTMLQRVWSDEFNGALVTKVMDRVLTEFKDFFTDEELRQIASESPDLQQTVDEIIKRTRDASMSDKVYQRASAWLKPKKPKGVRALQADARVKEAVNWILDAATKAGVEPTNPVSKKMTPQEQLLHLLTPGVAPKIQESIENAFTEMEWDAAISASKPDHRDALMEAKLAGEQPDPELVAKGLALPKFEKWVATRDFVTNNLLGYNPVTLKLVQDLVTSDFSGTKFGKPVAKPAVTKIDLVALAKSPDAEVKRVLDAYLSDIEANMQLKGAPPELRQRIKRMIYVQVRDQIAARREEFIASFISPKKSLPLSASLKLRQLINAGISKDSRFQNDKVRQLIKKIAGEYTKDVDFETLATSERAAKQKWMEDKAEQIAVAEKFSQFDEDTRTQLEATVWTYLAERLQAAEEGITRQFLRGSDVKYDREQMTPEQRQASLDAAKSKVEGLVHAGAFDASMVEAIGGKSSLAKLTPGLPELVKAALETPFYRQSELGEQFADKLVSEFSIDEAQRDKAKAAFNRAFGNKFKTARAKAAEKAYAALTPVERKILPQRNPTWRKILQVVNTDANFGTGEALREVAKANGWVVPSDEQIALVKDLAEQIQRLKDLTPEERAAVGDDPKAIAKAEVAKAGATVERRVAMKRQIETYWARWTQPITLRSGQGRANAIAAGYEFSAANLLFRGGFLIRQSQDVATQLLLHIPTRSLANAAVQHGGFIQGASNVEFWKDANNILRGAIATQIQAIRPALREAREAMRGTAEVKNVDRLMSGIALFERLDQQAAELDKAGEHAKAFAMRAAGIVKFSYRFASALDNLQGVPQEYQEMWTQAYRSLRDNGLNPAEAKKDADTLIGDLKAEFLRAKALARLYLDNTGKTASKAELDAAAWHIVKGLAYLRMKEAGMPADAFEEKNRLMRSVNAWNEGISNVSSVGGVTASIAKKISELGKSAAKAHPILMPAAVVPMAFGRFGNAIGTAIDRTLTFTPLGFLPGAFGATKESIDPDTGISSTGSPWYRTREDRAQRSTEAAIGTAFQAMLVGLVMASYIIVRNTWPKDKEERDLWERMGWKPGTIAFQTGDGTEVTAPMSVGPFAMLRPGLAAAGALKDALNAKAKAQAKLNAEAEKLGLPPGNVKPLDLADMMGIAGKTMWASIMGGRTSAGLVGALTDYGTFNASKTAAATVSPMIPGLPLVQEASRLAGVALDSNAATFTDFLLPMPTSGARRVNLLGDPTGTPDDMRRIVQTLTGGWSINDSKDAQSQTAYSALFQTGYRPPSISPNKAYAFDGAYRPMTESELVKYTQLRGQYLKDELSQLGDNPDERSARAAYQTANTRALADVGVQVQSRRAPQPESQQSNRGTPMPASSPSVAAPRFARVSAGRGRIAPIRRLRSPLRSSQRIRPLRPLKLKRQKYASVRRARVPRFV